MVVSSFFKRTFLLLSISLPFVCFADDWEKIDQLSPRDLEWRLGNCTKESQKISFITQVLANKTALQNFLRGNAPLLLATSASLLSEQELLKSAKNALSSTDFQQVVQAVNTRPFFTLFKNIDYTKMIDFFTIALSFKRYTQNPLQSAGHFIIHLDKIIRQFNLHDFQHVGPLAAEYEQQLIEQQKTPFIHSAQPYIVLAMDLYTQGWSIIHKKPVDNFMFFRFDNLTKGQIHRNNKKTKNDNMLQQLMANKGRNDNNWGKSRQRKYLIFMNALFFGNLGNYGSCSAEYFRHCSNVNPPQLSSYKVMKKLGLEKLYNKYKNEFDELERLHAKISNGKGVILQLAFTDEALKSRVFLSRSGGWSNKIRTNYGEVTDDVKAVTQILQADINLLQEKDQIEFCLIAANLEPGLGIEVYPLYDSDLATQKEYQTKRDQLFAKIKQEHEAGNK